MSDLTRLTIADARKKLRAKEIKAAEITDAYLAAIERANPALNAYIEVTPEKARTMAAASDAKLAKGEGGALEGIPLGIKDLFATEGVHTQACSHVLDGFKPRYESTVTSNLWADGAVMLGKLNMDEFAMGSSNETSHYGPVINPWRANGSNADLVPGGSSGGSAASVAAFLCAGATATDTGGSIRQPAAFTGTVGIKPTYGRCSRWGIVAFASSLDQAGPIARDVRDAAILLKSMASVDPKDTTSVDRPVPDYEAALGRSVKGMKVGIPKEYRVDGMPEEIEALWQKGIAWLKDAGAEIVDISLPHTKYALPAYYIVAPAEASSNLARYDGVRYGLRVPGKDIIEMYENTRAAGFGREVKRRIMIGTYVLSAGYYDAYYLQAQKVRNLIKRDFEKVFDAGVDVILTPATPSAAFGVADQDMAADPVKMYLNDIFTVTVNMAGLPGIAVPAGLDAKGLPLGLQLIGKPFEEETLFQTGHVIEQAAGRFAPEKWW
ncbi:Asp-tRNA(Asn)/Glu-tRNA(Gln) amidotransferase subunit GatA [Mesorhizobium sp. YM1C-6-2]|uniref:Asp-tRNA(Asn)/Glu-tRNA(Gln) amidotransferase subunit GatA n=1 Tax=Mesorhizobium sp. YM1C-6-2 TaxID=1827501 RepID=UPI000EF2601A|nr:Asp-tRNA(Asn)/Glu-tRNA(Gln) amidotransferase subunit GatA [Mesorhizobium sp. YM1C-6-2]RLP23407.1 Asp-tRNA(Asn)/Glu-tRNA(Gln) amidotransferase subunit GatA [Mesorhizobium sp. YM1C-6-2]